MSVDLAAIARDLKLPPEKVEKTVQLLDDGNTIPFITRFRKDETGGLNEKQIQFIKQSVKRERALAERRSFIIKSIDSQNKLTPELKQELEKAATTRRLEDLYLPFKPKKQTLATVARQQGLETFATEIFEGRSPEVDLAAQATHFVRVDKGVANVDEVIAGVGHLIAEKFSESSQLRAELRKILWNTGQIVSKSIEPVAAAKPDDVATDSSPSAQQPLAPQKEEKVPEGQGDTPTPATTESVETASIETGSVQTASVEMPAAPATVEAGSAETSEATSISPEVHPQEDQASRPNDSTTAEPPSLASGDNDSAKTAADESAAETTSTAEDTSEKVGTTAVNAGEAKAPAKKRKKKKKKKAAPDPFRDYHDFKQPLNKIPHHRILAINRGERAGKLRVKIDFDHALVESTARSILIPEDHPAVPFMEKCVAEAVNKSVIPSLEREIRRELSEVAEMHAVEVFANNLKNLLLQPPIGKCRVLAIDPGFKRGCTVAAIDETGTLIETSQIYVVGNVKRRESSAEKIHELVKKHKIDVIAIGNGTACRETEQMVSDAIGQKLQGLNVKYVILNEAGASTYSTSEIGREELPNLSPNERSAISIGRRLLDPLSELVKISPANIGVGMYQHDVKAKHLSESLDEVVQFCVNRVGVNVNSASPSLLRYVSGLNQLTARRVYEHRQTNGPYKNRTQLKEVTGFGDATFVQAVGFLRIGDGEQPLDATSIHPESYEIAEKLLAKVGATAEQMFRPLPDAVSEKSPAGLADASKTPTTPEPAQGEATPDSSPTSNVEVPEPPSETRPAESSRPELTTETQPVSAENAAALASEDASDKVDEDPTNKTVVAEVPADASPSPSPTEAETQAVETPSEETLKQVPSTTELKTVETTPEKTPPVEAATETRSPSASADTRGPKRVMPKYDPKRAEFVTKLKQLDIRELANEFSVGNMLISDILKTCSQPCRDPRDGVSKPIFRSGIVKTEDLKPDMQLDAQVVNVVDFGVFVDIGLGESCLIHVSQLSNRFIRNPHQFFAVGDVVKVWVTEIEGERRRVKLTAIKPGTPKFDHSKNRRKPVVRRSSGERQTDHSRTRKTSDSKGAGHRRGKPAHARYDRPRKRTPKPVKPITKEMLDGKEPMRSFSDLLQFVEKKPESKGDSKDDS